ncbi:MAG: DUF1579 family protein [Candidatus Kryptoniota bacterium]
MKKIIILTASALAMLSGQIYGQMVKPTFGSELARLSFLVGHFTTKTGIMMGDNSASGTGTIEAHWGLDSMFVLFSTAEENSSLGSYKGFGVLGYDSQNSQYVFSMFNNFGDRPEYKGNFVGDTLILTAKVQTEQGPYDQQMKWFKDGNNVRLLIFTDLGQGYSLMVDQTAAPTADSTKQKNK